MKVKSSSKGEKKNRKVSQTGRMPGRMEFNLMQDYTVQPRAGGRREGKKGADVCVCVCVYAQPAAARSRGRRMMVGEGSDGSSQKSLYIVKERPVCRGPGLYQGKVTLEEGVMDTVQAAIDQGGRGAGGRHVSTGGPVSN